MSVPSLDLFTGIGGFAYALKAICKPVGYCDRDPFCRRVLESLIRRGLIPKAPIHTDIKTLQAPCSPTPPVVVTGGFPCQDISILGGGEGLHGVQSRLFFELIRVVRTHSSVKVVILENSSALAHRGWPYVVAALRDARFMHIAYGNFTASEVGGLHRRTRMFIMACKDGSTRILQRLAHISSPEPGYDWASREPCSRLVKRNDAKPNLDRCMALGNAVVPQVVACACKQLSLALLGNLDTGSHVMTQRVCVDTPEGIVTYVRQRTDTLKQHPLRVMSDGHRRIMHKLWMTPVHVAWHQYRRMTDRGSRLLSNQIYWDDETRYVGIDAVPKHLRSTMFAINPAFIEYLMGFPLGWTAV